MNKQTEHLNQLVQKDGLRIADPSEMGWIATYKIDGKDVQVRVTDVAPELKDMSPPIEVEKKSEKIGKISI